ncbi:hypothetical protein HanXRQr2_Chr12g0544831 [Helianthus annuus]|uniref:Uncharacterized protein n=1 Tax=Helianthus annuus TaxID=4232 RepID=A0A9K3MWF0_HELAN|nr:hypothetical protein HanXRQr2_Chr12g0544831 [Helianthus annuus]KAJ0862969.1 hypothetical protein HanPSC8_Chr12g0524471 [Helianthus annuus]
MWLHSLHKNSTVYPPIQTTAVATMLCFPHGMVRKFIILNACIFVPVRR